MSGEEAVHVCPVCQKMHGSAIQLESIEPHEYLWEAVEAWNRRNP